MEAELRRIARNLRTALKRWGYTVSAVHHSPKSASIYYEVWHENDPDVRVTEVRISDHDLPYPDTRQLEIVLSEDASRNDADLATLTEDFDPKWQPWYQEPTK